MSSIWPEATEFLLLESREAGFLLVRTDEEGNRSEFFLTRADLICLSQMIQQKLGVGFMGLGKVKDAS
jgi:hypothetical protein